MFENLKKKLSGWFSSAKEKAKEAEEEIKVEEKEESKPAKVEAKKIEKKPEPKKQEKAEVKKPEKIIEKKVEKEVKAKPEIEKQPEKEADEGKVSQENRRLSGEEKPKEKKSFFQKIFQRKYTISDAYFNELFDELEIILLENNVAFSVVEKIRKKAETELVGKEVDKSKIEEEVKKTIKNVISSLLLEPFSIIKKISEKESVFVILFFGINGSGKTTSIAKIANLLKKNKISCVLAASDTFRAASIEQIMKHAEKLQIKVIKQHYGADPSAVAYDAIQYAKSHKIKAVLIDTAGRMHTKENLIKEMEKIVRVTKPDLKIFVGESITGNDATIQAKTFNDAVGIDGIILSKADVDEKAGTLISVSEVTGKPILYLGTGQEYDNLELFNKEKILQGLGL